MHKPLVIIIAGSKSDEAHYQTIATTAKQFGLDVITRISSAHKIPSHTLSILKTYEADPRPKVYITVAGRSNALSGLVDGSVLSPVIACPPPHDTWGVFDLFSSLRMPSGIAPAVVLDPANAAFLAARILAQTNDTVRQNVKLHQEKQQQKLFEDDQTAQTQ